jgi:hypothetical protein
MPMGTATCWSKCDRRKVRGMCFWCGKLKEPTGHVLNQAKLLIDQQSSVRVSRDVLGRAVVEPEDVTEVLREIRRRGFPDCASLRPSLRNNLQTNRYWSYKSTIDEPRILDPKLRRQYERERRRRPNCESDRNKFNWDDREGCLMHFRWPCNYDARYDPRRVLLEGERGILETLEDRVD